MRLKKLSLIFLLTAVNFSYAESKLTEKSQLLLDNLKNNIKQTVAGIVELEKASGLNEEDIYILLEQKSTSSSRIGVVVNQIDNTILSVSPGSNADNLGLVVGDKVLSVTVNNTENYTVSQIPNMSLSRGDLIKFSILRNDENIELASEVTSYYVPSWRFEAGESLVLNETINNQSFDNNSCGRLSVFFTPPETKYLFKVFFYKVNGERVNSSRHTVKLPVGKHIIDLHELIPARYLTRRYPGLQKAKPIELDIKANKQYYLAAKFDKNKRFGSRKQEYWEPQVWKVTDLKCEK